MPWPPLRTGAQHPPPGCGCLLRLLGFHLWYLFNSCAICSSCLDPFCLPYSRFLLVVWFIADCASRLASPAGRCSRCRLAPTTFSTRADSPFASILHLVSLSRLAVAGASLRRPASIPPPPRRPASIAPLRWRPRSRPVLASPFCSLFFSSCRLLAALASPDGACILPALAHSLLLLATRLYKSPGCPTAGLRPSFTCSRSFAVTPMACTYL